MWLTSEIYKSRNPDMCACFFHMRTHRHPPQSPSAVPLATRWKGSYLHLCKANPGHWSPQALQGWPLSMRPSPVNFKTKRYTCFHHRGSLGQEAPLAPPPHLTGSLSPQRWGPPGGTLHGPVFPPSGCLWGRAPSHPDVATAGLCLPATPWSPVSKKQKLDLAPEPRGADTVHPRPGKG